MQIFKIKGFLRNPLFYLGVFLLVSLILFFNLSKKDISFKIIQEKFSHSTFLGPANKLESPDIILVQKNTIQAVVPPNIFNPKVLATLVGYEDEASKQEIIEYTVEDGESLWSIAKKFNVSIETIVWANDLKNLLIRPGQKLLILPVSGVMHIARDGDKVEDLAKKYKAETDKILAFNDISGDQDIFPGELLIIPDGQLPLSSSVTSTGYNVANLSTNNFYGKSHAYPFGQCTWWVAQKRPIPGWGNARDWLSGAVAAGYPVCKGSYCSPQVGAVISLRTSYSLGHVGYVERVEGDKVIFSEMNYIGWGKMNYRSLRIGDYRISGYIY